MHLTPTCALCVSSSIEHEGFVHDLLIGRVLSKGTTATGYVSLQADGSAAGGNLCADCSAVPLHEVSSWERFWQHHENPPLSNKRESGWHAM